MARFEDLLLGRGAASDRHHLAGGPVARHRLSRFWLDAPVDQLEALYASPLGDLQRIAVGGVLVPRSGRRMSAQWRDLLAERMVQPVQQVRQINLLLALMPYTRPDKFKGEQAVADAARLVVAGLRGLLRSGI